REEAGQLFRDIAIAISAAVALSMLVAVAVVPTAAMRILKRVPRSHEENGDAAGDHAPRTASIWHPIRSVLALCDSIAGWMVDLLLSANKSLQQGVMPRLTFILVVVLGSCVATWLFLPKVEYLPSGNQNLVIAILLPPPGYNLDQLLSMGNTVEEGLRP